MSKSIFQKSALAVGLATAIAAPQVLLAADISGATDVAGNFIAPISQAEVSKAAGTALAPSFGYGKKVRIVTTTGGKLGTNAAAGDIYAFYFDASGNFLFTDIAGKQVDAIGADNVTLTLTGNTAAKQVAFVVATTIATDNVGGSDAGFITAINSGTGTLATRVALTVTKCATADLIADGTGAIAGGDTGAEANAIAAEITAAGRFNMTAFTGPSITSAKTSTAANTNYLKLAFDHPMAAISDNVDLTADIQVLKGDGTDITGNELVDGAVGLAATSVKVDAGGAFTGVATSVKTANNSADLRDLAANPVVFPQTVATQEFAAPRFATTGTAKVMLTAGTGIVAGDLAALHAATGQKLTGGETLILTVRMDEKFDGTGVNAATDIAVTGNGAMGVAVSSSGAGADTFTVTLTESATETLTLDASGNLLIDSAELKLGLTSVIGSKLTTAESKTLDADVAGVNIKVAIVPAASTVSTADADANGTLDGVKIKAGAPLTSPLAASGVKLVDRDTVATVVPSTVTVNSKDATGATLSVTETTAKALETTLAAGETVATHMNTANTSTSVNKMPYDVTVTSSDITFAKIYAAATGNLLKISDIGAASAIADGAAPVVLKVTRLKGSTEGSLNLVLSEAGKPALTPKTKDVAVDGGALILTVANANDAGSAVSDVAGGGTAGSGAYTTTTVANDTLTFYNVDNAVLDAITAAGITAGNTTISGFDDNLLGAQEIAADAATNDTKIAPTVKKAVAVESSDGFIKTVLLNISETVTLKGAPKASDFVVTLNGIAITPSTAAASGNILTITLPGVGIRRDLVTANGSVTYTNTEAATKGYEDTDKNILANFGATTLEVPRNSEELHIQEISAKLTSDGTALVPEGTLVRAQLVEVHDDPSNTYGSGTVSVPCNCDGKNINIALQDATGWTWTDVVKDKYGEKSIDAYVEADSDTGADNGATAKYAKLLNVLPNNAGNDSRTYYKVKVDRKTGAISGQVKGKVNYKHTATGTITVLDDTWQTVGSDGNIRMSVGVTDKEKGKLNSKTRPAFVLVSVKRPTDVKAILVTSPVPNFSNHMPFVSELDSAGKITGALGTVDLSKIEEVKIANTNVWQLLAMSGDFSFKAKDKKIPLERFFMTIDANGGSAGNSRWLFDGNEDMAFRLRDNKVDTDVEINNGASSVTSGKIPTFNGGDGLAFDEGGAAAMHSIWVPITGNTVMRTVKKGWTLMTSVAAIPEASFAGSNIDAVICTGGGEDSTSWFKGASNQTLNSMQKGKACFVYFSADAKDFKFGK